MDFDRFKLYIFEDVLQAVKQDQANSDFDTPVTYAFFVDCTLFTTLWYNPIKRKEIATESLDCLISSVQKFTPISNLMWQVYMTRTEMNENQSVILDGYNKAKRATLVAKQVGVTEVIDELFTSE